MAAVTFRSAASTDSQALAGLVDAAYGHYVDRIGMVPGPMTQDYAEVIATRHVAIAEVSGSAVGLLVVNTADGRFVIDNVAVHPDRRGTGLGTRCSIWPRLRQGEGVSTSSTYTPTSR